MKRALLALVLVGACTLSMEPALVLGPIYRGVTVCRQGMPVSVIRGGLSVADSTEVEAHEATHRRQMRGHCDAAMKRYNTDRTYRVRMETEAYCAGIRTQPASVYAVRRAEIVDFVVRMFPDVPPDSVKGFFAEHCP